MGLAPAPLVPLLPLLPDEEVPDELVPVVLLPDEPVPEVVAAVGTAWAVQVNVCEPPELLLLLLPLPVEQKTTRFFVASIYQVELPLEELLELLLPLLNRGMYGTLLVVGVVVAPGVDPVVPVVWADAIAGGIANAATNNEAYFISNSLLANTHTPKTRICFSHYEKRALNSNASAETQWHFGRICRLGLTQV